MAKTPSRRLTYKERVKILTLAEFGWKQVAIAQQLGIRQSTISNCLRSPCTPTKPKGSRPILNTPLRCLLVRHATENAEQRRKTREQIAYELGIDVCRRTLIKAFGKELYHRRKATQKPFLTEEHKAQRVQWAWQHLCYDKEQQSRVGWSDEMSAWTSAGEVYVTRRAEEALYPDCLIPRFKDFSSCMVWSIISLHSKRPLVFFEKEKGSVDSQLLKWRLAKRFPNIDAEVKQHLKEEWEKIEVNDYKKYITSMRDRCWAVIKAGGGPTKR
ncbi:hypothetical protein BCR34DRAFT_590906 [Clohesyomyces aquaticus]|uniref:Transposase Tc1-like domain-containing protein n=1 Tax=Clohesyomyces aquaticus TaxID=1231657 RepID=A0A1Y1Z5G0_9PLEO|nr:hypothetical protein BCR34DRAFT_590906 [Clohesyomyces aquaticus]